MNKLVRLRVKLAGTFDFVWSATKMYDLYHQYIYLPFQPIGNFCSQKRFCMLLVQADRCYTLNNHVIFLHVSSFMCTPATPNFLVPGYSDHLPS